jgi:hypothetical protein
MHKYWKISTEFVTASRFKKFASKYPREFVSCGANAERLLADLQSGIPLSVLAQNLSFFRSEREGLYRIGQTNVPGAKENRLYLYPDEAGKVIYLLDIGTKETQRNDIASARKTIREIRRQFDQK